MLTPLSVLPLLAAAAACMASEQAYLSYDTGWKVAFDPNWDVLGPFPIHAREQHFISPAFPLNLSLSIDYAQRWPSSYADGGLVNWTKAASTPDGHLEVSFPNIRWKRLRSTEGWAALQHHAVLRTTLTVYPPSDLTASDPPQLLVELKQASYFTLRPQNQDISAFVPKWYAGNIYDLERALPHVVDLPTLPSPGTPTKYDLFVSGDYEIRLFGDPLVQHSDVPVQKISLAIQVQDTSYPLVHKSSQDVICDFLDGYALGDALGVGIQSTTGWWTAQAITLNPPISGLQVLQLSLSKAITIAPSQTRIIPIEIKQSAPYFGQNISLDIIFTSENISQVISTSVSIKHRQHTPPERQSFAATFFFANASPSPFIAVPPMTSSAGSKAPPILALHGAGVDILSQDFWVRSLPYNHASWIVVPTGRTSWGMDWHGPSADDAWSSLEALTTIVARRRETFPDSWEVPSTSKVVVVGHSNGGQGTWYLASRYPDRVVAAIPAAAYVKSQSYVPLTHSRGARFTDPTLRSILDSAQTPDDNDLHVSNLVDMPLLAIHGGDDQNVPTWHSREATAALKAWYPSTNITYKEDPGKGHWYAFVLQNREVQAFLDGVLSSSSRPGGTDAFTLTVTIPRESGSLKGWSINELAIPGRLGRLHVHQLKDGRFEVEPSNVRAFTVPVRDEAYEIIVDDQVLSIQSTQVPTQISKVSDGQWEAGAFSGSNRSPGRMQAILSSPGPIIIITAGRNREDISAALRLSHVLHVYHRLDTEIVTEDAALQWHRLRSWPSGNVVVIGNSSSPLVKVVLQSKETAVHVADSIPMVGGRKFNRAGQALLFLHPHPTRKEVDSYMMFILHSDESSLERAVRLFPFRTGIAVPEWLILGKEMDTFGAGGVQAAGVWDGDWGLSQAMSWFYH